MRLSMSFAWGARCGWLAMVRNLRLAWVSGGYCATVRDVVDGWWLVCQSGRLLNLLNLEVSHCMGERLSPTTRPVGVRSHIGLARPGTQLSAVLSASNLRAPLLKTALALNEPLALSKLLQATNVAFSAVTDPSSVPNLPMMTDTGARKIPHLHTGKPKQRCSLNPHHERTRP